MLRGDARGGSVRAAEDNRAAHLSAGHVERLGRGIDQLVHRLHGEVPRHEFDDRLQPGEPRADAQARKTVLGDRRVDHALDAEFLQQALGDFVGALIFRDLFAHHEDILVAAHLLRHGVAQGFAHGHGDHLGAGGHVGIGQRLGLRRHGNRRLRSGRGARGLRSRMIFSGGWHRFRGLRLGGNLFQLDGLGSGGSVLTFRQDGRDRRIHRHVLRTFGNENLPERTLVGRLDLHGGLVGLDLGNDVATADRLAFFLQPFGEIALLHGRRKGGHQHLDRHGLI